MAINFDAASNGTIGTSADLTVAHTCTGSNLALIVCVTQQGNPATPTCTYNGVSMTRLTEQTYTNGRNDTFYLLNPSTGTHNIVVSVGSDGKSLAAGSYTGIRQDSQPDATNGTSNSTANTGFTASNVSVADNCWTILSASTQVNGQTASTGATQRATGAQLNCTAGIYDSNGPKTPAGNVSESITYSSARYGYTILSLSPHSTSARYWGGGTGTWDTSTTTHWSLNSGGSGGAEVPTADTATVIFDGNSGGGTVTLSNTNGCVDLTFTGFTGTFTGSSTLNVSGNITFGSAMIFAGTNAINLGGNIILVSGTTYTCTGILTLTSTSTGKTITSAAVTVTSPIVFNGVGGGWTLQDNLTHTGTSINLTNGSLNLNNKNVSTPIFSSANANTRILTMGSGTVTLIGTGTVWDFSTNTNLTLTINTSTIKLSNASSSTKTFSGGSLSYYNLWLTGIGTGAFTIVGSNTFNDFKADTPPHTINFTALSVTYVNTFTVNGTTGNLMTLQSSSSGTLYYLVNRTQVPINCDYLSIQDSHAS